MSPRPSNPSSGSIPDLHLATIAHDGIIWDAFLEFEDDMRRPLTYRARLRFDPPTSEEGPRPSRTTVIIIEDSFEAAVAKARGLDDRQLQGLLRSTLPEGDEPL